MGGKGDQEFAMSQMLVAEGEDLYAMMQKYQPTKFVKEKAEDNAKFWNEVVPQHMGYLEKLHVQSSGDFFTSSGQTTGELYLFAMMHQAVLVSSDCLKSTPGVQKWYDATKAM